MRVLLADPPAFTPAYDHDLARALAAQGADVELVTSRFRFGAVPPPEGYARTELYYPLSSRLFRRSRLRIPLKAAEHLVGAARLSRRRPDVTHVQWLVPELDRRALRLRTPSVFTAHDLLPRRTAARTAMWRELLSRFDRVVVHSERGREALAEIGVEARVIPHPVFRSDPPRGDDGRTLLAFGVIRPYKGLEDAIEVARRTGSRLLVVGDPLEDVARYRELARGVDVEWRLGYVSDAEVDRAHGEATLALLPYRPELDQSGALMRALGAGVPAVVNDIGGLADPIRAYGAGGVARPGDLDDLTSAVERVLTDPRPFRAGAERARDELTWERSARQHLELYRELVPA
jgi:glycosyltransferase involved in cell wall biosynthesis